MRRALLLLALGLVTPPASGEQTAVYRATGTDVRLLDQYDNDGYSLAVVTRSDGSAELTVRVSDSPLQSGAKYPTAQPRDATLPAAPDRDAFARRLVAGSRTQVEAVRRVLLGVASDIHYDTDRHRQQDPAAVFTSRRAHCVGFSELAVDLLRRAGISARTVQGVLRTEPGSLGHDASIGGAYHRWIEVHYPDRGYVFSDPSASINGVDARYIAFTRRSLVKPRALTLTGVTSQGRLSYDSIRAGETTLRVRPAG